MVDFNTLTHTLTTKNFRVFCPKRFPSGIWGFAKSESSGQLNIGRDVTQQ